MAYPQRQLWALALSGVLTEMNGAFHTELGGWARNEHTKPWCQNTLRDFYGVASRADFDGTVTYLLGEGHTAEARALLASLGPDPRMDDYKRGLVRANRAQIERAGLLAWDTGRLVAVVGWGFWAEYVSEEHAWQILLVAAARVQKAYDSWRAFGEAYELGRLFWSGGKPHDGTARAMGKLLSDPESPWVTIPWSIDLGVTMVDPNAKPKARFKKSVCPSCGAPKSRASTTAYVYCDYCGALSDFDFAKACEKPLERPGPVYEKLHAQLKAQLDAAKARGDVNAYRAMQRELYDAYVTACPNSVPFRVKDPAYRAKYVAYMAESAVVRAFDATAAQVEANVARATAGLSFQQVKPGVMRVPPQAFEALASAIFAQEEYFFQLFNARGVYAMQPDGATPELQQRVGFSLFVQGWMPMIDDASAARLLERTRLKSEYVEAEAPAGDTAGCGACGAPTTIFSGARRVVCEHCGHKLDAERVACTGCGASLAPDESAERFNCPHCRVLVQRVRMMRPG
jgi:DNA-directed RNA polymerase subunit RPC12/RpoP